LDVVYVVTHAKAVMLRPESDTSVGATGGDDWLQRFHDGDRGVIEHVYRDHFDTVARAVGPLLGRADKETATQEIFFRLVSQRALRAAFRGGDLRAWIEVVARNHAIDYLRRRNRETPAGHTLAAADQAQPGRSWEGAAEARLLIERFRAEVLPPKWAGTFELRFIQQLSQTEAGAALGIGRTTLAYQEARVRRLLRKFLLQKGRA
jgi:RNA polymerase sigma-70 factor (ECF subfamily)